jgi:LPXTG-motif cell wall-anchored protein
VLTYRPAPGFVGSDSFVWSCEPAWVEEDLYTITVRPRPAPATPGQHPTTPAPAVLPATGAARVPPIAAAGLTLLLLGALATWLGRPRSSARIR